MSFFRLKHSSAEKEIGRFPQVSEGIYSVKVDDPQFIGNVFLEKAPLNICVPAARLSRNAKKTDLISVSAMGFSGRLLISDKLKLILEEYTFSKAQLFETYLIDYTNGKLVYWLLNPYVITYEVLDFENSVIWINGLGNTRIELIKIQNLKEFNNQLNNLQLPKRLFIERPVLHGSVIEDFFILRYVNGGIGYYISEKLKKEIENAGCTGIEFEPIESA